MSRYLETPIEFLKGVGPQKADLLKIELQVFNYHDLLFWYPFRYVDRTRFYKINELTEDMAQVQVIGRVSNLQEVGKQRGRRLTAQLTDETGMLELVWFKGIKWISKSLRPNTDYVVFGKPSLFGNKLNIAHPEMEVYTGAQSQDNAGFQPVYNTTEKLRARGLDGKAFGKLTKTLLQGLKPDDLPEMLPPEVMEKYKLMPRFEAMKELHQPSSPRRLEHARARMKFEELFMIQVKLLAMNSYRKHNYQGFVFEKIDGYFTTFYENHLKFDLTGAQKRVLKEIRRDVLSGRQMNRLLQGDVGSGKTIVALMTQLMAIDNGYQAALMAPTEILAQQHFATLTGYLQGMDVKVELLTGSVKGKQRKDVLEALEHGYIDILIGTHALIENKVKFKNLGCVVIDEQHRFGVEQRARLWEKNMKPPHVLVMTATPIPRTLAMTIYGDLDVSVIDELPPGRKPVKTVHNYDSKRLSVFEFLRKEIAKGRQVYIVYPLIEESETLDYKNLMDGYEAVARAFPLPDYRVSIVHGQMKPEDKDLEMQRFVQGKTHIMVATTVIEVGVNVPNASVMIIESAERFGLSQLHQLRGRVGRGAEQSYCILMTAHKLSTDARKRLQTMVATNDGFEISEVDLKLRGPGNLEGKEQSGLMDMKIADIGKDTRILQEARICAQELMETDPRLAEPRHAGLKAHILKHYKDARDWSMIS